MAKTKKSLKAKSRNSRTGSKEPNYSGVIDGIKYAVVLTDRQMGSTTIEDFEDAIKTMGLIVNPSPEANLDGPEFYFAVISGKKLSKKQMTKIYKDFYKDD
jgi:predicted transcriptional regulator